MKSLKQFITESLRVMSRMPKHTTVKLSKLKKGNVIYLIPDPSNVNPDDFKELVVTDIKVVHDKYQYEYWDGPQDIPVKALFVYVEKNDEGIEYFWDVASSVKKSFSGDEFALTCNDGITSFRYCKNGEKPDYSADYRDHEKAVVTFNKEELDELTKAKLKELKELENKQKSYLDNVAKKLKALGEPVETIKVSSYRLGQYLKRNCKNDFPTYYDCLDDAIRLYYNDDLFNYDNVKDMVNSIFGYSNNETQIDVCIHKNNDISFMFGEVPAVIDHTEIKDIKSVKRLAIK